jgi:acetyl esterase/lipase
MSKFFAVLAIALIVGGLAYHFASLAIFNALAPRDPGARLLAENVTYGSLPRQRLDLYAPEGEGRFPALLFIYGGSWDSGSKDNYGFVGHALAAQGYLVAIADYRLVPEAHYPAFVDDTALALEWLLSNAGSYGGDSAKLFAMGHSAGAYNVVQAVLRNGLKDKVKAIVTLAGPFDFLPLDSPKSIAAFSRAKPLEETQPVNADLSAAPPILILHGSKDVTVGLHNARNLQAAWQRAKRHSILKVYEGVSHVDIMLALSLPLRKRAPSLVDAVDFFQRYD